MVLGAPLSGRILQMLTVKPEEKQTITRGLVRFPLICSQNGGSLARPCVTCVIMEKKKIRHMKQDYHGLYQSEK